MHSTPPLGRYHYQLYSISIGLLLPLMAAFNTGHAHTRPGRGPITQSTTAQSASVFTNSAQKITDIGVLEPGKPILQELAGGEVHSYRINLAVGQFLRVLVDQRGIDLTLALHDPNNRKITEADSPVSARGPERISVIADVAGSYRLELRPKLATLPRGRYEARIADLRAAQPDDQIRITAERMHAEATFIFGEGTGESRRKAIEKYKQTIPLWQSLGDPREEGHTLLAIGFNLANLSEHKEALEIFEKAAVLMRAARDREGEATVLYSIGLLHNNLDDHRKALDFYDQALIILRAIGDRSMEANTLGNTGSVYASTAEYQQALEYYTQSLVIKREVGDPPAEATLLNNLGFVYGRTGQHQKALEYYNQALPILRAINDRSGEGTTLNNIGSVYNELGDPRKALEFYTQAADIKRAAGRRAEEAIALSNIGFAYNKLGEYSKALEFYNQSLTLATSAGVRSREAVAFANIGKTYADLGDHRKALEYYGRALPIQIAIGERRGQATTLNGIGKAHQDLGDPKNALEFYHQALAIRRATDDLKAQAETLYDLARAQRDLNNLDAARSAIEDSISAVESLRVNVKSPQLRASYLASVRDYYQFHIDVLMQLHKQRPSERFDVAALNVSERSRARALLELLKEGRAEIHHDLEPSLIARERMFRQTIGDKADRLTRLLSGKHTKEQVATVDKEIESLATEYEQIQGHIRHVSPRYAALTQPVPLTLKEIQTELLDPDTLLLEYALGDDKSYLWVVTTTSSNSFELPKREEIEALARDLHEHLTARNQGIKDETAEQRRIRLARAETEYAKKAFALSEMVLTPIARELKNKRIVIVSEGALQYVPFAALPDPLSGALFKPLIVDHEIVNLPSASVLAVLRQETRDRKPPAKTVAVLADPVFSETDPRLTPIHKTSAIADEGAAVEDLKRSASESGLTDLMRLRFSRLEAEEISKLASEKMRLKALDFAASRATATSGELSQYRIVHFATHGLINNKNPELSGVVFSLVDTRRQPQNGFLRLYDIYNLKLSADLVVLSACQTALGKNIKGEGIVGLTRGFMYAGAPRIVASLWRVEDRATAQLMQRFYARMLGEGLTPSAALRAAQVSMLGNKRWQAPYYWAGFTLQGEWK